MVTLYDSSEVAQECLAVVLKGLKPALEDVTQSGRYVEVHVDNREVRVLVKRCSDDVSFYGTYNFHLQGHKVLSSSGAFSYWLQEKVKEMFPKTKIVNYHLVCAPINRTEDTEPWFVVIPPAKMKPELNDW